MSSLSQYTRRMINCEELRLEAGGKKSGKSERRGVKPLEFILSSMVSHSNVYLRLVDATSINLLGTSG